MANSIYKASPEEIAELRAEALAARRLSAEFVESRSLRDLLGYAAALELSALNLECPGRGLGLNS